MFFISFHPSFLNSWKHALLYHKKTNCLLSYTIFTRTLASSERFRFFPSVDCWWLTTETLLRMCLSPKWEGRSSLYVGLGLFTGGEHKLAPLPPSGATLRGLSNSEGLAGTSVATHHSWALSAAQSCFPCSLRGTVSWKYFLVELLSTNLCFIMCFLTGLTCKSGSHNQPQEITLQTLFWSQIPFWPAKTPTHLEFSTRKVFYCQKLRSD